MGVNRGLLASLAVLILSHGPVRWTHPLAGRASRSHLLDLGRSPSMETVRGSAPLLAFPLMEQLWLSRW